MQEDTKDYAELLSIGVNSSSQGKGLGKFMLSELENMVSKKGCGRISLTTDCHDNTKAIKFYKSMGYEVYYEFITYPNRKMYRMIKLLK
nr:GNAT family N-acetyltransferase [Bacteroides fragilis]